MSKNILITEDQYNRIFENVDEKRKFKYEEDKNGFVTVLEDGDEIGIIHSKRVDGAVRWFHNGETKPYKSKISAARAL